MNADWTSAGNEARIKKKNLKKSPITLVWFNYLRELLFSRGFIHMFVMNSICEGMEETAGPTWCSRDMRTQQWKGEGQNPSCRGDTRDSGRGHDQGGSVEPGCEEQESNTKQRDVGDGREWPEKQQEGEEGRERNCEGCCHSQMLILISRMQSLVKILSDLCQIL